MFTFPYNITLVKRLKRCYVNFNPDNTHINTLQNKNINSKLTK